MKSMQVAIKLRSQPQFFVDEMKHFIKKNSSKCCISNPNIQISTRIVFIHKIKIKKCG